MQKRPQISTIRVTGPVAERFRLYSRAVASSHSHAMEKLLDQFSNMNPSCEKEQGRHQETLEKHLLKRINSVIAIIRNIERTQSKPIMAMLQLLFEEKQTEKKEILLERKQILSESPSPGTIGACSDPSSLHRELAERNHHLEMILNKVRMVRSPQGKIQFQINISREEFEEIRSVLDPT